MNIQNLKDVDFTGNHPLLMSALTSLNKNLTEFFKAVGNKEFNSARISLSFFYQETDFLKEALVQSNVIKKVDSLDFDRLKERIAEGGAANALLKDLYIATYRGIPTSRDLKTFLLDSEGKELMMQILLMRDVPGWSDDEYFKQLQEIQAIECDDD